MAEFNATTAPARPDASSVSEQGKYCAEVQPHHTNTSRLLQCWPGLWEDSTFRCIHGEGLGVLANCQCQETYARLRSNSMLEGTGKRPPKALKTGTTICGVVYEVSLIGLQKMSSE
jgi:hypothetical protein